MADHGKLFGFLADAFERALRRHPDRVHESYYVFGGQNVRLRVVGRELARDVTRPFAHLRASNPLATQLAVDLWDENEIGIRCQQGSTGVDVPWSDVTTASPDGRFLVQRLPNTLTCLDLRRGRIVGSIAWSDQIFIYERAKPLARLLLEWHNHQDVQIIHAGLVCQDGRGVLFVGRSGSGKSTAALACLCSDFKFLSEDYVGLQARPNGGFLGHSLYSSVFLDTEHLARFASLAPYVMAGRPPHELKSVVLLSQPFPDRLERAVPITVLIAPHVVEGSTSSLRPISKGQALLALGVGSLLQIPSPGVSGIDKLRQLVDQVPCYGLEFGRDMESMPRCVKEILAEVSS
jgi:hypothetical protein